MYSEYDLQNLNHLQKKATIQQNQDVDMSCLAAMYCGQNVFSIFFDNKNILAYLTKQITNEMDEDDEKLTFFRRLLCTNLVTPVNRS